MAQLVHIQQCRAEYSENLLSDNSVITDQSNIIKVSGSALSTAQKNNENFFEKSQSIKVFNNSSAIPLVFFAQNSFDFITNNDGNYILSLRVLHKQVTAFDHKLKVNIFANGFYSHTLELSIADTQRNEWLTFAQSFNISNNVSIGMTFEFLIDPTDPSEQCELWLGGVKMEYDDRNLGIPSVYSLPRSWYDSKTGWESKSDTTNTIALTGGVNNLFSLTATSQSNGGLIFLDNVSKIHPLRDGDAIVTDLAFTAITPSGTGNYIEVLFIVNSVVYGAQTIHLLKGSGNDDYIRVSFGFPVTNDFWINGGEFFIKPNVNLNIKDRYISVTRVHKGI
jgi:hypothetical protein